MVLESRSLPADTTFAAVGLRPEADHDDGATDWSASASDRVLGAKDGFVRREFRLTIANRGATAREFHARIDYYAPAGELLRRRKIEHMMVPPFTENSWIGSAMLKAPGEGELVVRVVPSHEPLDPGA